MSAWVLPDDVADSLPSQARHIEECRRQLLDTANGFGYELVIPPLMEHLESLLSGTGEALSLQTFKLVDQLSGRSIGIRADTTAQVARIDAHLLGRQGVTRLCYCGPVLHTRSERPYATREPLQFGAEVYGHVGLEADLEILELAITSLQRLGVVHQRLDLADVRIVDALLADTHLPTATAQTIHQALSSKDADTLQSLTQLLPLQVRQSLQDLMRLYGDVSVLEKAKQILPASALLHQALNDLSHLAKAVHDLAPDVAVGFDLADLQGYSYYTGMRFAIYGTGHHDSLARGGRYDEVGAAFGRKRPAVGFSLDIKELVPALPERLLKGAILAPWQADSALRETIQALRQQGHTVVSVLPGHEAEIDEFHCDSHLVCQSGQWQVQPIERKV